MSTVCVYSYADADLTPKYVDENDFNYTGTWSSSGTYVASTLDVVTYATALYICIDNNVGDNPRRTPTRTNPANWSILSLLYEYQCEDDGTNTVAEEAYNLAVTGTNIAWAAYALAQIGTNTGSTAYSVATAAYALAELGTIIPPLSTLPDVSIPAPTASQVLTFDGSLWVAGDAPSTVSPSAFTYYTDNTASGTLSLYNLTLSPSGTPEHQEVLNVGATTPFVAARSFISPVLNRTIISSGAWQFNTYAQVNIAQRPYQIVTDVYRRSIAGVSTYLFSGTSNAIVSLTPQLQAYYITQGSFACSVTDRLVFEYAVMRTGAVAIATVYSAGTAHDSSVITPIGYAHNDLEGLQGGATGQYYHATLNQHDALVGTSGTPSGSNPYVTFESLVTEQGTRSQADQVNYTLALSGSNTAWAALVMAGTVTGGGGMTEAQVLGRIALGV